MKPLNFKSQRLGRGIGQTTAGSDRRHFAIGSKAVHPQDPFHRLPGAIEVKPPICGPRHGHDVTIDHRCGPTVQFQLPLQQGASQFRCGLVQIVIADRPLDLERDFATKKHMRTVGLDVVNRARIRKRPA